MPVNLNAQPPANAESMAAAGSFVSVNSTFWDGVGRGASHGFKTIPEFVRIIAHVALTILATVPVALTLTLSTTLKGYLSHEWEQVGDSLFRYKTHLYGIFNPDAADRALAPPPAKIEERPIDWIIETATKLADGVFGKGILDVWDKDTMAVQGKGVAVGVLGMAWLIGALTFPAFMALAPIPLTGTKKLGVKGTLMALGSGVVFNTNPWVPAKMSELTRFALSLPGKIWTGLGAVNEFANAEDTTNTFKSLLVNAKDLTGNLLEMAKATGPLAVKGVQAVNIAASVSSTAIGWTATLAKVVSWTFSWSLSSIWDVPQLPFKLALSAVSLWYPGKFVWNKISSGCTRAASAIKESGEDWLPQPLATRVIGGVDWASAKLTSAGEQITKAGEAIGFHSDKDPVGTAGYEKPFALINNKKVKIWAQINTKTNTVQIITADKSGKFATAPAAASAGALSVSLQPGATPDNAWRDMTSAEEGDYHIQQLGHSRTWTYLTVGTEENSVKAMVLRVNGKSGKRVWVNDQSGYNRLYNETHGTGVPSYDSSFPFPQTPHSKRKGGAFVEELDQQPSPAATSGGSRSTAGGASSVDSKSSRR